MKRKLSLIIPTNGIIEWVLPVLDSIYKQNVDESLYEVIVTDNGNSKEFEKKMKQLSKKYSNFIYKKTNAVLFNNQIEAFKLSNGEFIKFVNHRMKLNDGALKKIIDFVDKNIENKPITFFLNSTIEIEPKEKFYSKFDSYAYALKNYSSWSGGISCWKDDLNTILPKVQKCSLFPHINFCYFYEVNREYYIDNQYLFTEISVDSIKKGRYDVFYAFGIEYVELILDLFNSKKIDEFTKDKILNENEKFLAELFLLYILMKKKCSYDVSSYKKSLCKYYSLSKIILLSMFLFLKKVVIKIKEVIE